MNTSYKSFRAILFIICLVSQLFLNTGCALPTKMKLDQEESNIETIEIVEANCSFVNAHVHVPIMVIEDKEEFLNKLKKIKYKDYPMFGIFHGIGERTLAVKITYDNGDYEVFSHDEKSNVVAENGGYYRPKPFGWFDDSFYDLIYEYLDQVPQKYNFMHSTSQIKTIEIVNSVAKETSLSYETVAKVADQTKFIEELNKIDYVYRNDEICDELYNYRDQNLAVRIEYQNGDYEVFTYNHKDEAHVSDETIYYLTGTYIGTFNKDQFSELIEKYLNETAPVENIQ